MSNQGCWKVQTGSLTRQIFRNFSRPDLCVINIKMDKHGPTRKLSYAAIIGKSQSTQCATEGTSN